MEKSRRLPPKQEYPSRPSLACLLPPRCRPFGKCPGTLKSRHLRHQWYGPRPNNGVLPGSGHQEFMKSNGLNRIHSNGGPQVNGHAACWWLVGATSPWGYPIGNIQRRGEKKMKACRSRPSPLRLRARPTSADRSPHVTSIEADPKERTCRFIFASFAPYHFSWPWLKAEFTASLRIDPPVPPSALRPFHGRPQDRPAGLPVIKSPLPLKAGRLSSPRVFLLA